MRPNSRPSDRRNPARARRIVWPALVAAAIAISIGAWWRFRPRVDAAPRPVVALSNAASVDEEVTALVSEHVRRAREAPGDAELRANLAMVYEANELWDEARRGWEDALALDPGSSLWRYHLAICARQAGDSDRALELLREVAAQEPALAAARYRLGDALLE